jgi:drug/metabolite transporter (DMT)-like permease
MKLNKSYLLAFASVFAWGMLAPLSKVLLKDFTAMEILGYGSFFGSLTLLFIILFSKEKRRIFEYKPKDWIWLIFLGIIGYFAYNALYNFGLTVLPSQTACILNYLWPIFTVIFASIILKEKLSAKSIAAIILSFIGAGVVVFHPGESYSGSALLGAVCCIIAAAFYGLFCTLNKKTGKSAVINMFVFISCGAAGGLAFSLPKGFNMPTLSQLIGILWLGIVVDALGYLFWAMALERGDTAKISNIAYATPVISLFLSTVIGEKIYITSVIGIILIIGGFLFQLKGEKKQCG